MRLIINVAMSESIRQIYVTFYNDNELKHRLFRKLQTWGFFEYGEKFDSETVLLKRFQYFSNLSPKSNYPLYSLNRGVYLVRFPSQISNSLFGRLSASDASEVSPYKNNISKNFITKEAVFDLRPKSVLVFYTKIGSKPMVIGIGVVERVSDNFSTKLNFLQIARKKSVFLPSILENYWNTGDTTKIKLVDFLFVSSLTDDKVLQDNFCDIFSCAEKANADNDISSIDVETFHRLIKGSEHERYNIIH